MMFGHWGRQAFRIGCATFLVTLVSGVTWAQSDSASDDSSEGVVRFVQFQPNSPIAPVERNSTANASGDAISNRNPAQSANTTDQSNRRQQVINNGFELFGEVNQLDRLSEGRRARAFSPGASAVFGSEAKVRITSDVGSLLKKSISSQGVATQNRTPIVTDSRVRGQRVGQVLASGSYWAPARMDLDTMMNKMDSRLIDDAIVIKGPYSGRYGPGFRFVDISLIETPRYEDGYQTHGSTSFDYIDNGEQSYGRQSVWGGSDSWGYHVSYGHRTGNDYETGADTLIPSSYKSRDLFVALGSDLSESSKVEFNYLRLDQTDLEFPGLVYDLRYLGTEGYELRYLNDCPLIGDAFTSEVWFNRTRFHGDTRNPSKARQIPLLSQTLFSPSGFDGFAITNGAGSSFGHRTELFFGDRQGDYFSVGTDVILLRQGLNDIEPLLPSDNNFPIPPSESVDVGFFIEDHEQINDWLGITAGMRGDVVTAEAARSVVGVPGSVPDFFLEGTDQTFGLWMAYVTAQIELTNHWQATFGGGYGERPPTLTELYAMSSFIGSLQRGFTFLLGDPGLDKERVTQFDVGLNAKYDRLRGGINGYYSWVDDFITYDLFAPSGGLGSFPAGAGFVNTSQAIIAGVDAYGQLEATDAISLFGTFSYVEGRDQTGNRNTLSFTPNGGAPEPLPGIPPLESRLGVIVHDPSPDRDWAVEFSARVVDNQDRVARSLEEIATPGFTTYDIRSYWRLTRTETSSCLLTVGCENITDKFYREHLDYRTGLGVFRPGVSVYSGLELTY
ncbi:MAG: TonB-dependent receptor [Pirellulaceae bacterium]